MSAKVKIIIVVAIAVLAAVVISLVVVFRINGSKDSSNPNPSNTATSQVSSGISSNSNSSAAGNNGSQVTSTSTQLSNAGIAGILKGWWLDARDDTRALYILSDGSVEECDFWTNQATGSYIGNPIGLGTGTISSLGPAEIASNGEITFTLSDDSQNIFRMNTASSDEIYIGDTLAYAREKNAAFGATVEGGVLEGVVHVTTLEDMMRQFYGRDDVDMAQGKLVVMDLTAPQKVHEHDKDTTIRKVILASGNDVGIWERFNGNVARAIVPGVELDDEFAEAYDSVAIEAVPAP